MLPTTMALKLLTACLLLTLSIAVHCQRRGPHHPHGQIPVHQKHHHYQAKQSESLLKQSDLLHDTKHLEEDTVELTAEKLSKMSPDELEFYYFLAHDFDKNSMLDGLELLKAVYHTIDHHAEYDDEEYSKIDESLEPEHNDIDSYIAMVDRTLISDDTNDDGYLSYAEYKAARKHRTLSDRTPVVLVAAGPSHLHVRLRLMIQGYLSDYDYSNVLHIVFKDGGLKFEMKTKPKR